MILPCSRMDIAYCRIDCTHAPLHGIKPPATGSYFWVSISSLSECSTSQQLSPNLATLGFTSVLVRLAHTSLPPNGYGSLLLSHAVREAAIAAKLLQPYAPYARASGLFGVPTDHSSSHSVLPKSTATALPSHIKYPLPFFFSPP